MKKVEQLQTIQQVVLHCRKGDLNALKKALDYGFNVNTIDPVSTDSPLMIACRCGHPELVRLCLSYGAKNDPHPDFGQTALHAAVSEGQYYCAAVLLEVAAQSDAAGIISNLSDSNGQTPLHVAATVGDSNMIELLLSCDARISCVDVHGQTSLHLCGGSGNEACLAMLLDHSGDELLENEDINGNTVLHHASYNGHISCVRLLLETAANVMVCNHKGQTPYNLAQLRGHKDIVALLTEYSDHHQAVMNSRPAATPQKGHQQQQHPPLSLATPVLKKKTSKQDVFSTPQQGSFLPRPPHTMASPTATSPRFTAPAAVQRGPVDPQQPQYHGPPLQQQQLQVINTPDTVGYSTARNTEDKPPQQQRTSNGLTNPANSSIRLDIGVEGIPVYTKQKIIQSVRPSGSGNQLASPQAQMYQGTSEPSTPGGLLSSHQVEIEFEDSPEKHSSPYDEGGGRALASPPSTPAVKKNLNLQYDTSPSPTSYFDKHSPPKEQHHLQQQSEVDEAGSYADPLEVFMCLDITWHTYTTEEGHTYYLDMSGNNHSQWEDPRTHGMVYMEEYDYGVTSESIDDDNQHQHSPQHHMPPKSPSPKAMEKIRNFGSHDERDEKSLNQVVKKIDWDEVVSTGNGATKNRNQDGEKKAAGKLKDDAKAFLKVQAKMDEIQNGLKFSIQDELRAEETRQQQQQTKINSGTLIVVPVDESKCQEYLEQYKAGKTLLELREAMESRNESEAFMLHVFAAADEIDVPERSSSRNGGKSDTPVTEDVPETNSGPATEAVTIESLLADATLAKYVKMSRMGVPVQNVLAKMRMDDIEIGSRNKVLVALGAEPEPETTSSKGGNGSKPSANFQTLHWNTLPAERLKNSIWSFNDASGTGSTGASGDGVAESEIQELEKLFAATSRTKEVCKVVDKQVIPLKVLERKRAQNIAIGLVPFKVFGSHLDILKSICSLNTLDDRLTADHLDNFRNLLPTDAEMKRIHEIKGSKHPAELFIQTALLFYPELPKRLTSFAICLTFPDHCASVIMSLKLIINCCNQVLSSSRLAKLLKRMLAIGNVMNQGTQKGQAAGFTLDSLLKMVNTKGVDNKTSLLDYLVKSLYDKGEQNILAVVDDLNLVDKSSKLSDLEVLRDVDGISKNYKFLNDELKRNELNLSGNVLTSPTAKVIVSDFHAALQAYLQRFLSQVEEVNKWSNVMRRKVKEIVEYFGEDAGKCDTVKIFAVLQEFRTALLFSKESVEWKIRRANGSEV